MTFLQWQKSAISRLQNAGFEPREAGASARFLLDFHTRQKNAALLCPDETLEREPDLESLLRRLENREPLPHLLGSAPFFGLDFEVSSATLIPRPETETLVETVLARLQNVNAPRVCDLGTGSGAIAISIARTRSDAHVFALEISPRARVIARRNAEKLDAKIEILGGASDWFSPLGALGKFDALVSNPPYIAAREIEELQPEVKNFEPRLALDGGEDGLDPYRVFAARGRQFLRDEGFFAMELGAGQWDEVRVLFEKENWRVQAPIFDFAGIARVLVAHSR